MYVIVVVRRVCRVIRLIIIVLRIIRYDFTGAVAETHTNGGKSVHFVHPVNDVIWHRQRGGKKAVEAAAGKEGEKIVTFLVITSRAECNSSNCTGFHCVIRDLVGLGVLSKLVFTVLVKVHCFSCDNSAWTDARVDTWGRETS